MIAALYTRVSMEEQTEGFSLSAQLTQLTQYCQRENIEIYKVYSDEGISGQKENRPQFQAMLSDAQKGLFKLILVHKYDRFARKVELSQRVKNQLKKSGVNVISITEPIEDSPMGFFVSGLHDLLAEYYVRNLAQESKKGHVERASQGYHNGSVPYGYKRISGTNDMVINEEQAKIVKWIFDMYNRDGYGSTKIAAILSSHNILGAVGGAWSHFTVSRLIKNIKYIGKIEYDGKIYDGKHEPIVTEEEFYLAQKFIKDRTWKREYRGINHTKFLLLGFLYCGECGKVFRIHSCVTSSTKNRKNSLYYYVCNNATHVDKLNRCTFTKNYSTVKLEQHILDYLKRVVSGVETDLIIKERTATTEIFEDRKTKIQQELTRIKQAFIAGVFTLEEYTAEKNKRESELSEIETSKVDSTQHAQKETRLRQRIKSLWEEFEIAETIPERKRILKEFIDRIEVGRDLIKVIFIL